MNKKAAALRELSTEQLVAHIDALRRSRMGLRLNAATGHVKETSDYKKLKDEIARGLTILRERSKAQAENA